MRESVKTVLFWVFLLALFLFLWAVAAGSAHPVTGAKMAWVVGGVAVTVLAMSIGLAVIAARTPGAAKAPWVRAAALSGTVVVMVGGVIGVCHAALVEAASWRLAFGPVMTGTMIVAFAAALVLPLRRRRRLNAALVAQPSRDAADAVLASIAKVQDLSARNEAAVALIGGGFPREALTLLDGLKPAGDDAKVMIACNVVIARLMLDDVETASATLAAAPAAKSSAIALWRRVMDARVHAHAGRAADALAILDELTFPESPMPARRHADIARAHALAAKDDREAARTLLRRIGEAEPGDLKRIAEAGGPAAPLAAEVIAAGPPFR